MPDTFDADLATYNAARRTAAAARAKAEKAARKKVEAAYYAVATGIEIDMMDIPKIFNVGLNALADGADDETLKATIAAYVATIRKN